jgi:hypothetical protein
MPNNSLPNSAPTPQSNWPFALIAVLMAVALWLFVRTGAQVPGPRPIQAPPKQLNQALIGSNTCVASPVTDA